jgi:hypothetical protein
MEAFAQQVAADGAGLRESGSRWDADDDVNGTADVVDDMTTVRNALVTMGGHFSGARASMIGMADAIAAVDDLLVAIEAGELPASRQAIEQFEAAIALLDEYADADTTSAFQLATAAKDAAVALKAIIDGADVVGSSPTAELLEKAAEAADKLSTAQAGLLQVASAAQAVKDIRDSYVAERAGDTRIALLGRVEEVYEEMVAMHVANLSQWSALDAPAQGDQPAGRFAAAEASMHALLGTKGTGQVARTSGRVEEAFDAIAIIARDRAEQAAARAEAVIAPVSAQDPRSAGQVAFDAADAAVLAAINDQSRPEVLADAGDRADDAVTARDLTIDLSQAVVVLGSRIDGAQESSALEPLYRAVPVSVARMVDFENTTGVQDAPTANTPSQPGTAGASNLASGSYAGFDWSGQSGQSWAFRRDASRDNGFTRGVVSGEQGAFNNAQGEFFLSRSEEWTPESAWFTGAWNAGLTLTFIASRDGVELASRPLVLGDPSMPRFVDLRALGITAANPDGWSGITSLRISSSGGTSFGFPAAGRGGEMFVMDDLIWSGFEAPLSRADWTVTYDASARAAQGAAIESAVDALDGTGVLAGDGIFAAINELSAQEAVVRELSDAEAWATRIQAVLARGRDALQSALEAADGAATSERSIEAEDAEAQRILSVSATLHALASELETQFGAEFGFSAGVDGNGSGGEDRLERTQAAADAAGAALAAAATLRAQADQLVSGAASPLGGELEAWAAQVRSALAESPVAAGTLAGIVGRIDDALDTYRLRATAATDAFADYAASAADAADAAAGLAGEAASPIEGVDAPVAAMRGFQQVTGDAARSEARIAALVPGSADRSIGGVGIGERFESARDALDGLAGEDGGSLGARTPADDVLAQLGQLHEALVGVLGSSGIDVSQLVQDVTVAGVDARLASLRDGADVGDQHGAEGLMTLAARVAPLLQDQFEDGSLAAASAGRVEQAADARDSATQAATAAERLAAIADDLESRFGERIDGSQISANAAAGRAAADQAEIRRSAAAAAHEGMLARLGDIEQEIDGSNGQVGTWAEWVASVGARADQILVAARTALTVGSPADAQALAAQLGEYSAINARGAAVFAGLAEDASEAILTEVEGVNGNTPWAGGDLQRFRQLRNQSEAIASANSALDGAEAAAGRAHLAADQAESLRDVAVARELDAYRGLQRTIDAPTVTHRTETVTAAVLSRAAADLSGVRRDQAGAEVAIADAFQNGTPGLSAMREAWGSPSARDTFVAQVNAHEQAIVSADGYVNGARPDGAPFDRDFADGDSLRAQVDFYDTVVQTLAGRVDGARAEDAATASAAAGDSQAVRAVAIAAARQLAVQADAARTMATEARTNAGRFLGRAMVNYVANAQEAHLRAIAAATAADEAAGRAEGHASDATSLVPGSGQLVSGGSN